MATISTDKFDALKRYVGVRLQQGVPIVDADWNELEDTRRFELRAFLKWYVGDGVPEGNDGFRIVGTGQPNSFSVRRGATGTADGLVGVGRCLVDGLDVMIEQNVEFNAQLLHPVAANSLQLANDLQVPRIDPLTTPTANGNVTAYLDVWERYAMPVEDPAYMLMVGLGLGESCARRKREWVVRVRPGSAAPVPGNTDFLPGHSYYALARIARRTGDDNVNAGDVTDVREQNLLLLPATLSYDALGVQAEDYRRAAGRPPLPLREAINALLLGDFPGTPPMMLATVYGDDRLVGSMFEDAGGVVVIGQGRQTATGRNDAFGWRLDLANPTAGFGNPTQITSGGVRNYNPVGALLPDGQALVAYTRVTGINDREIQFRNASQVTTLPTATPVSVAPPAITMTTEDADAAQVVVGAGVLTVFYWQAHGVVFEIFYRRFDALTRLPIDTTARSLGGSDETTEFRLATDAAGVSWIAVREDPGTAPLDVIRMGRYTPGNASTAPIIDMRASMDVRPSTAPGATGTPTQTWPWVAISPTGEVWVLWSVRAGLMYYTRFRAGAWEQRTEIPVSQPGDEGPVAAAEPDGSLVVFFARAAGTGPKQVMMTRRNAVDGAWSEPAHIGQGAIDGSNFMATLRGADGTIRLAWTQYAPVAGAARHRLAYRELILHV